MPVCFKSVVTQAFGLFIFEFIHRENVCFPDPALSDSQITYSREKARNIAQRLLDWRVITDIEGETVIGRKFKSRAKHDLNICQIPL